MNQRIALVLAGASALCFASCGGGGSGSGSSGSSVMDLQQISNGFGVMVPHQVFKLSTLGQPTPQVVLIRKEKDLFDNVVSNATVNNKILPTTEWPVAAILPNGDPGNHFVYVTFNKPIDISTVMTPSVSAGANSQLLGSITVQALDPASGDSVPIKGRAFIGGQTYAGTAVNNEYPLEKWVKDQNGQPVALTVNGAQPGLGFPGTQSVATFTGSELLTSARTFVFVVDIDGDLTTHDTLPTNRQIRVVCTTAVRAKDGDPLIHQAIGSTTVGPDTLPPEVLTTPPPTSVPVTDPAFNQTDVDPLSSVVVSFTEPVQPLTWGAFPGAIAPPLSGAASITFGPQAKIVNVPFAISPVSIYDLTTWEMMPSFNFPGAGPADASCGTFDKVTVTFNAQQFDDLVNNGGQGNTNTRPANTQFFTGEGPGLVNAPVAPGAILVGRQGAVPGISVVDLNGFGGSTGNPSFNAAQVVKGNSNYPNNPNVLLTGASLIPALFPGTCTVDGGSAGPMTLTLDSSLNDLVVRAPVVESVGDMMLGWSLDVVYNNGQPGGCQAGAGGNLCAITGKKLIITAFTTQLTVAPLTNANTNPAAIVDGGANLISWEPSPNPPPLVFPPLCVSPFIGAQEPTSTDSATVGFTNLLAPGGSPLFNPVTNEPPKSPMTKQQNTYFVGPSPQKTNIINCLQYQQRQQIGHFLYVIDRGRRELVILNSNRMTVIDRIQMPDPTDMAMGPNLDVLAVSNQQADLVIFVDIDPASSNFHQVIKKTKVGRGPRGIAWDPGNEDILVCNEQESSLSLISSHDFNVRRTVQNNLDRPFDVAVMQRQRTFAFLRDVYYAWILNRDGSVALFESGPNGVNGWGYDDVIGALPFTFQNPKRLVMDYDKPVGSVWILHENKLNKDGTLTNQPGGAVTNVITESSRFFPIPLDINSFLLPGVRDLSFAVNASIGQDQLSGTPVDIAFDDLANLGGTANQVSVYSPGQALGLNGKSYVRVANGLTVPSKFPEFMFLAVPVSSQGTGVVDIIDITGNTRLDTDGFLPGIQSIPAPGASILTDYWRQ